MKFNKKLIVLLFVILLPSLLIIPGASQTAYFTGSDFSDVAISHYPNLYYLKENITQYHEIPLWNASILGGSPFDADPLSGLWYPPGWLALLFPLSMGINIVVWLHILFGGLGFYLFLRKCDFDDLLAGLGALVFVSMPKIYAHFGAGHVTYLFAFTLTPWLLYVSRDTRINRRWWQALLFGLTALADLRWLPFSLAAVMAVEMGKASGKNIRKALSSLIPWALGLGLAAVLLLPLSQFAGLSTRTLLTPDDNLTLSLPPVNLLNLLFATPSGTAEWVLYCGAGIFLLAIISLFSERKQWTRVWGILWGLCMIWSLGSSIPGLEWIVRLPALNLLRVPPRAMFLGDLAMICLAVEGLRWALTLPEGKLWKPARLTMIGIGLFSVIFAVISITFAGEKAREIQRSAEVCVVAFVLLESFRSKTQSKKWQIPVLFIILVLDCAIASYSTFEYKPRRDNVSVKVIETILSDTVSNPGRIYSPSYSIPQDLAAEYGWKLAEGINPLQLRSYVDFLASASGVPADTYSVVQPPLENGIPDSDNLEYQVDLNKLRRLGVTWVVSAFEMNSLDKYLVVQEGESYLYRITDSPGYPRIVKPDGQTAPVEISATSANQIIYKLDGSVGKLETAEIYYPGWVATVDGQSAPITADEGLFRSVEVPAGASEVSMEYHPTLLYVGAGISLMWIIVWLISYLWKRR